MIGEDTKHLSMLIHKGWMMGRYEALDYCKFKFSFLISHPEVEDMGKIRSNTATARLNALSYHI